MNMILVRTIKLRLNEPAETFQPTIDNYTKSFNDVCQTGWNDKDFNGVSLHNKTYQSARKILPAQLAVSARMKATEALKSVRKKLKKKKKVSCPQSRQTSIRYDARSYNVWFDRNEASFSTINGRKIVKINVPEYFQQYLSWKRCSADLFIRKGRVFLNIVFSKEINNSLPNGRCIGIDRGIKKLAVTSDYRFFGGGFVKQTSRRYQKLRSSLQSKKTRSAKRHFAKISSKENRFRRDTNHCIAKQIVSSLKPGTTIAIEKLTGLKENTTRKRKKKDRFEHNSWSYYQLEQFLTYKAEARGINVEYVDARFTSKGCSRCGHVARGNRTIQSIFKCKKCGFQLNADLNASRNISQKHLDAMRTTGSRKCHPDGGSINDPNAHPLRGLEQTARSLA